jgi:hypothetical protein
MCSYDRPGTPEKERDWLPTDYIFDSGQEAGAWVKMENMMCATHPSSFQRIRRYKALRITNENPLLWRQRIEKQLADGELQRVPWHEYYYQRSWGPTGLYEHIDPDDGTKVRFIACATDGLEGRFTSMNPGRFIRQFIEATPDSSLLDRWCAQMGLDATTSKLKIARSPEDVVRVYTQGPHSCMGYPYPADPTRGNPWFPHVVDQHPVNAYGNSDLGVAYITRMGEITARCLVWPEKKQHSRIYGDNNRLLERLKENGYVENWAFIGARIRQLRSQTSDCHELILPYIDGDLGVIPDGKDWLILSDKPHIIAKSPNGLAYTEECEDCGARGEWLTATRRNDDDELTYVCKGCL